MEKIETLYDKICNNECIQITELGPIKTVRIPAKDLVLPINFLHCSVVFFLIWYYKERY